MGRENQPLGEVGCRVPSRCDGICASVAAPFPAQKERAHRPVAGRTTSPCAGTNQMAELTGFASAKGSGRPCRRSVRVGWLTIVRIGAVAETFPFSRPADAENQVVCTEKSWTADPQAFSETDRRRVFYAFCGIVGRANPLRSRSLGAKHAWAGEPRAIRPRVRLGEPRAFRPRVMHRHAHPPAA